MVQRFWNWYEKHLILNISVALFLFLLQIIHLYWLGGHVISERLTGQSHVNFTGIWYYLILIVDYTEIPALISTALIYINELRKGYTFKNVFYLLLLLSQVLHIFWITDEYVVEVFTANVTVSHFSGITAWIAILIDYLEVPVIIDTVRRLYIALKQKQLTAVQQALKENG